MRLGFGMVLRLPGILLLVLAVSPVTAPFSSFDLAALFHDTASHGVAALHTKPPSDDPVVGASGSVDFRVRLEAAAPNVAGALGSPRTRVSLNPPLRI